jgi:hypothetical protein
MAAQRSEYRAVTVIEYNGVRAYSPGDPVDARVVEPAGWVRRADVEPVGEIPLPVPAKSASQGVWADYAVQHGMDPAAAAEASRADLIKAYGGK